MTLCSADQEITRQNGISSRPLLRHESGQSLVEAAVAMVVLLLIFMGVLDLGRAYFTYLALQNAAGEGAAYGAVHPSWHDPADNLDPNNVEYRAQHESPSGLVNWSTAVVTVSAPNPTPGNTIDVTVSFEYPIITPVISAFAGGDTITLRATSRQIILGPSS